MKNILHFARILILLLCSQIGNAQIELTPLQVCDMDYDGYVETDLNQKRSEILDGDHPSYFEIGFYETLSDAELNNLPILSNSSYVNIQPFTFVIYFRKYNLNTETATVGFFTVNVIPGAIIGEPINLFNASGEFDLTENETLINTDSNNSIAYYTSLQNALNSVDAIVNLTNFTALENTTIWVVVTHPQGCTSMTSFNLIVDSDSIVFIPDVNFKNTLLQANNSNGIAKNLLNQSIIVDVNGDGEIQYSEALNVFKLNIGGSNIADQTGIEAFTNLTFLNFSWNHMSSIDLSVNINLQEVLVGQNYELTSLILGNLPNLNTLNCSGNLLTNVDLSGLHSLNSAYLAETHIFELDFSNNPNLKYINIGENSNLQYLNIKNGSSLDNISNGLFLGIDNLYICADEFEIANLSQFINQLGTTGQVISSYCTFYPQGDYNTITGRVLYDLNNDGICDEDDLAHPFIRINITDGTDHNSTFSDENGDFIFFAQGGNYSLATDIENPEYFNITPESQSVTFADNDNNTENVNFCITPNGIHNDLEVVIAPITPARPGFEATYKIVYRNKGNQILSEEYGLMFFYNQHLMSFVSSSVSPGTEGVGAITWNYENLMPFESREVLVTMLINPPTHPENPVNIDDVLVLTANIMTPETDETIQDNIYILNQTVVGSYDPNDITCLEGELVNPILIGEELHYVIRFENTGTFYAENVVVVMEIDTEKYDVNSVRILNTSHSANAQIRDNVLEVFFNQIMLDSGGHGNILLVMKSKNTLIEGDSVQSKADIYFDYNYPIFTNDAVTVFGSEMSIEENVHNIALKFYPNPASDYINISSQSLIKSIELYEISGRLIQTSIVNSFEIQQNVNNLNNGIYILKINTESGEVTTKIVKK